MQKSVRAHCTSRPLRRTDGRHLRVPQRRYPQPRCSGGPPDHAPEAFSVPRTDDHDRDGFCARYGLFLGSGTAIAMAGPAVILTYAIGSALASVIGAATGEMAVRYPVRGGFGTIVTRYLGPFAGFF